MNEIKTKYNVGDKVKVRSDLYEHQLYDNINEACKNNKLFATKEMVKNFSNKKVTIKEIVVTDNSDVYYRIKEDEGFWLWKDEMFKGLVEESKEEDNSEEEIPTNIIHKNNLNTGDIVVTSSGLRYLVMKNTSIKKDFIIEEKFRHSIWLYDFNDNLKHIENSTHDIVDILKPINHDDNTVFLEYDYKSILPPKKKMTVEEMKKELEKINDCEIEIVRK